MWLLLRHFHFPQSLAVMRMGLKCLKGLIVLLAQLLHLVVARDVPKRKH